MKKTATPLGLLLGRNIAERRIALGLTQAELAEKLEADVVTISRFERGSHLPSLLRLQNIAAILDMPLAELLSQSTNLATDQSLQIHSLISGLSEEDRQLLISIFQSLSHRLRH